jgi:MoaA/NifB/PqqE/SkfB family radical SAM enzyme
MNEEEQNTSDKSRVGTFTFLAEEGQENEVSIDLIDDLVKLASLSNEDTKIVDDVRASLKAKGELPFQWTPQESQYLKKQPREKWLDYIVYRYKFTMFPKNKTVSDFPVYLLIEPASVCNLRCTMCFQVDKTFTRKPYMGLMDMGLFRDIVDEAAEGGTQAVTLASRGEPTLHPQLGEMLDYMTGKFIEIKLTTNATKLTEELSHQILSSGVNMVVYSIDAYTKDLYEQIRVNGDFDEVYENIVRFSEIRKRDYPNSEINTRASGVRFREDQDRDGFVEFWSEIVDQVGMKDAMERWNTYENDVIPNLTSPCWFPWERLYIWYDGTTNPCDPDYKSSLSPGKVGERSIRDIWHGEELTKLRNAHLSEQRGQCYPCDRCGLEFE